jgi:hypothetical protein
MQVVHIGVIISLGFEFSGTELNFELSPQENIEGIKVR